MRVLVIQNKGVMAMEAITLIGASTKRGDESLIGKYGSGLNYSIANLLKQRIDFKIAVGERLVEIKTVPVNMRGTIFNRITVDGENTSFTDTMGMEDWEGMFPIIREIYSNALDEDPDAVFVDTSANSAQDAAKNMAKDGYTTYAIEINSDAQKVLDNLNEYFAFRVYPLYVDESGNRVIPATKNLRIYRKGIVAYTDNYTNSLFNYDLSNIRINESRVVSSMYDVYPIVGRLLENITDRRILYKWLNGIKNSNYGLFEHKCILETWNIKKCSPEFLEVILENKYYPVEVMQVLKIEEKEGRMAIPRRLIERFQVYAPDLDVTGMGSNLKEERKEPDYVVTSPSPELFDKVLEAEEALKASSYKPRLKAPYTFVKFKDSSMTGDIKRGDILLSINMDLFSIEEIAAVIVQQQERIHTGFDSSGNSMKNHFVRLYTNEIFKTKNNEEQN